MRKGIAVCARIIIVKVEFFYEKMSGDDTRTLLNPRAWRYHSFTELRVDFRERSNMKRMATASLQTRGSMFTNSLWPPKSHIENVIVVRRTEIVFSMKLTPGGWSELVAGGTGKEICTQRLNIVLVETALDVLDHQACLSYLRVANHADLDDNAEEGVSWDTCGGAGRVYLLRSSPFSGFWEVEAATCWRAEVLADMLWI